MGQSLAIGVGRGAVFVGLVWIVGRTVYMYIDYFQNLSIYEQILLDIDCIMIYTMNMNNINIKGTI